MTFISYAQNFEDVMLWRALKHLDSGFYIDVGANDPSQDSVTKAFYDQGWRGINIEPVAEWFERLSAERPRDVNLQLAAGAESKAVTFYEIPKTGLSTLNKAVAEKYELERGYSKIEKKISVNTITEICEKYHIAPIHFLKIDAEGAEKQVLQGIDFSKIRPWIILAESTLPGTQLKNHQEWEEILLLNNYEFVYFDGLNRFYVSAEHSELKEKFCVPPNFFDNFSLAETQFFCGQIVGQIKRKAQQFELKTQALIVRSGQVELKTQELTTRAEQAELKAQELTTRVERAELEAHKLAINMKENEILLYKFYHSKSWRITYPLRQLSKYSQWLLHASKAWLTLSPGSHPRRVFKKTLIKLKFFLIGRPKLKKLLMQALNHFPKFREKLKRTICYNEKPICQISVPKSVNTQQLEQLTPRARMIYIQLKEVVKKNKELNNANCH